MPSNSAAGLPLLHFQYEPGYLQPRWDVGLRTGVAVVGGLALLLSRRVPRRYAWALGAFGVVSLVRAATNRNVTDLFGGLANPILRIDTSILIERPVPETYAYLREFANYPAFLSDIQDVKVDDAGGLEWVLRVPGGVGLHWHSSVLRLAENRSIGWGSQPGSLVRQAGLFEFEPTSDGTGTRLRAQFAFAPPGGAVGYVFSRWLGFDPRATVARDLVLLRALIERRACTTLPTARAA